MPTALTTKNFRMEIMKANRISIVQFKTEWSGASQIIDPIYSELAKSYKGQVDFYSVDVEKEKDLYEEYMIKELPTILFFKNGDVIDHVSGLTSKNKLIAKIENALATLN
jgi:thioredoxin 1